MGFWKNIFNDDKAGDRKSISSKERKKRNKRRREIRKQRIKQK